MTSSSSRVTMIIDLSVGCWCWCRLNWAALLFCLFLAPQLGFAQSKNRQVNGGADLKVDNGIFRMSLPPGFTNAVSTNDAGKLLFIYVRPHSTGGGNATISIRVPESGFVSKKPDAPTRIEGYLKGYFFAKSAKFPDLRQEKVEEIELGGIPFKMVRWSGKFSGRAFHSRLWVASRGGQSMTIEGQDLEPMSSVSMPEIEKAVSTLTFGRDGKH